MIKILSMNTNIMKIHKLVATLMIITIISGYFTPLEGVFAADYNNWETEYFMGDNEDEVPISNDEYGDLYLDVKEGQNVKFHMRLTEKGTAGSGRYKETFIIAMPEMLYESMIEDSDIFQNGWIEFEMIDCGHLLEVIDPNNIGTATNSNASGSNATSSNSLVEENEEGIKILTFRFVEELRNENNNIEIENATGTVSFIAPIDGRIAITQYKNNCWIDIEPLNRENTRVATGTLNIGGQPLNNLSSDNSGTGWKWNASSNTITLDSSYKAENLISIDCDTSETIKLVYEGDVIINSHITCNGSLEISGTRGILTVGYSDNNSDSAIEAIGNITISGGTVKAIGGHYGICSEQDTKIEGGTVEAIGRYSGICSNMGSTTISGGATVAASGDFGIYSGSNTTISDVAVVTTKDTIYCGIWSDQDTNIEGGTVEATSGYYGIVSSKGSTTISGGTVVSNGSGKDIYGTLIITGGSIYLTNNSFSGQPTDTNNKPVYLNILTVGSTTNANNAVTDVRVSTLGYNYGFNNVSTDSEGKVYFWLPMTGNNGTDSATVSVTVKGRCYAKAWARAGTVETETLELLAVPDTSSDSGSSNTNNTGQWKFDEKGWWYRYENGSWAANSWVYLYYNGFYAWYHFDADGYMQTGWLADTDGNSYYLNPLANGTKGAMKTGWVLIDGKWYYFNDTEAGLKGALFTSTTTPDGYQVDENGVWSQIQ